jgi:hypothetical protein
MSEHARNTTPMLESLRRGAKTWSGTLCQAPVVKGKKRCRMHGGAAGSGAPKANRNALKHGLTTRGAIEQTRAVNTILRRSRKMLDEISRASAGKPSLAVYAGAVADAPTWSPMLRMIGLPCGSCSILP